MCVCALFSQDNSAWRRGHKGHEFVWGKECGSPKVRALTVNRNSSAVAEESVKVDAYILLAKTANQKCWDNVD